VMVREKLLVEEKVLELVMVREKLLVEEKVIELVMVREKLLVEEWEKLLAREKVQPL
jgi:hypothetical protein